MNWQDAWLEDKHTSAGDGLVQQPEYVRAHCQRISGHVLVWTHTNVMNGCVQQPEYVCTHWRGTSCHVPVWTCKAV